MKNDENKYFMIVPIIPVFLHYPLQSMQEYSYVFMNKTKHCTLKQNNHPHSYYIELVKIVNSDTNTVDELEIVICKYHT